MTEEEGRFKKLDRRCIWPIRRHVWSKWWTLRGMKAQFKECARCGKIRRRLI